MKRLVPVLAIVVALAALGFFALRLPSVEDRLFESALEKAMAGAPAALFDGDGLKIFICGSGSPLPSAKRAQNCAAVIAGDKYFLVDAGTGSWEVVQAAGIPANRLAGVFLTHFHSDHIGDLSEANLGSWVTSRPAPLSVYGPTGVRTVIDGENAAFALDSDYRIAHHGKGVASLRSRGMVAREFDGASPVVIYEIGGLKVTAFPVKHEPALPAVGYRFDYKGRSVVLSGDTAYADSLIAASKNVDVLIHEAQATHMVAEMQAAAAKAGHATLAKIFSDITSYHASPVDAARAANEAGADWLVLSHLTPAPDNRITERIFMRGVSEIRSKNVMLAEDRMLIVLPEAGGVEFSKL